MREYPYIGKLNDVYHKDGVVLFTNNSFGCVLRAKDFAWEDAKLHEYCSIRIENCFTNITKEYLSGKCVKIESPEHSEFVQKLAFKAGYSWSFGNQSVQHTDKLYLYFYDDGDICYNDITDNSWEQIQLPMPPNNNLQEEDVEEWQPIIGEKALAPFEKQEVSVTVAYFDKNNCGIDIALVFSDKKPFWVAKEDLKPLSKEDVILQEITTFLEDAAGLGSKVTAMGLVEKFKIEMKEE